MIKIFDNFISDSYQKEIEDNLNQNTFPWYLNDSILVGYDYDTLEEKFKDENVSDTPGLTHTVYVDKQIKSPIYEKIKPMLYILEQQTNLKLTDIIRIRIRRTLQYPNHTLGKYCPPHCDLNTNEIYYVDDTDGDTVIFDKTYNGKVYMNEANVKILKRINPKRGRLLMFDGKYYHSGNAPTSYVKRTVINFDVKLI